MTIFRCLETTVPHSQLHNLLRFCSFKAGMFISLYHCLLCVNNLYHGVSNHDLGSLLFIVHNCLYYVSEHFTI